MVKDHEMDLKAFQSEASTGTSQAVKNAAGQGATVVSMHLDMIKQIATTHHVTVNSAEASGSKTNAPVGSKTGQ
jgi:hypothetical protein